jgi:hypothetical protein
MGWVASTERVLWHLLEAVDINVFHGGYIEHTILMFSFNINNIRLFYVYYCNAVGWPVWQVDQMIIQSRYQLINELYVLLHLILTYRDNMSARNFEIEKVWRFVS